MATAEELIAKAIKKTRLDLIIGASTNREDVKRTNGFSSRSICFARHKVVYEKDIFEGKFYHIFYGKRDVGSMTQIQMAFHSALARYNRVGNCYEMAAVCAMYLCDMTTSFNQVEISTIAFPCGIDHMFVKIKIDDDTFICDPWSNFYFNIDINENATEYLEITLALLEKEQYLEEILLNIDRLTKHEYFNLRNSTDRATYANLCKLFYQRELAVNNENNPHKDAIHNAIDLSLGILPSSWKRKMKMRQIARFIKMRELMESGSEYFPVIFSADYDLPAHTLNFFRRYTHSPGPLFALTHFQATYNLGNPECNEEGKDALGYILKANNLPCLEEQFLDYEKKMDADQKRRCGYNSKI